jgi:protease secretion system outer membrane protein
MGFFIISNAYGFDLYDAYNMALGNDPTFRASMKERDINDASFIVGRSAVLPKLISGFNLNTNRLTNAYSGGISQRFDNYPSTNNYIQLVQPIFDLSAYAKYQQGVFQKEFGDYKFQADTLELLLRTAQLYMDVLYSDDQVAFLRAENASFQEQMKIAEKGIVAGESSKIDYLESKSAFDISSSQILEAELQARDSKRKLGIVVGIEDIEQLSLKGLGSKYPFFSDLPHQFSEIQTLALENNLDLKVSKTKIEIANQDIVKNSSGFLPQISAIGSYSRQNSYTVSTLNIISNQSSGGVQVTWPLFSSGETYGQTVQSISQYQKSIEEYNGLKLNIMSELKRYYDQANFLQNKIKIFEKSLDASKEAKKASILASSVGLRTGYDVLYATKNVFNVNKELSQAKYAYILSNLKVKQLAGILKIEDLEKCAKIYFH